MGTSTGDADILEFKIGLEKSGGSSDFAATDTRGVTKDGIRLLGESKAGENAGLSESTVPNWSQWLTLWQFMVTIAYKASLAMTHAVFQAWGPIQGTCIIVSAVGIGWDCLQCSIGLSLLQTPKISRLSQFSPWTFFSTLQILLCLAMIGTAHGSNVPTLGGSLITLTGTGFDTIAARIGTTACDQTVWISSTALVCKSAPGVSATLGAVITINMTRSTVAELFSYDGPETSGLDRDNLATQGNAFLTVNGVHFRTDSGSIQTTIGQTGCEQSTWTSETSITAKHAHGQRRTLTLKMTSGLRGGTTTETASYSNPMASEGEVNQGTTGQGSLT
eukprot:3937622-Rhodomonas_salina.1